MIKKRVNLLLLIPLFILTSYNQLFINWQIQHYNFNELQDFGRYVFIIGISFAEAFIIMIVILFISFLIKSVFVKRNRRNQK